MMEGALESDINNLNPQLDLATAHDLYYSTTFVIEFDLAPSVAWDSALADTSSDTYKAMKTSVLDI